MKEFIICSWQLLGEFVSLLELATKLNKIYELVSYYELDDLRIYMYRYGATHIVSFLKGLEPWIDLL